MKDYVAEIRKFDIEGEAPDLSDVVSIVIGAEFTAGKRQAIIEVYTGPDEAPVITYIEPEDGRQLSELLYQYWKGESSGN